SILKNLRYVVSFIFKKIICPGQKDLQRSSFHMLGIFIIFSCFPSEFRSDDGLFPDRRIALMRATGTSMEDVVLKHLLQLNSSGLLKGPEFSRSSFYCFFIALFCLREDFCEEISKCHKPARMLTKKICRGP